MKSVMVRIRGIDTALFRDGRPFDTTAGSVANSLSIPFPSTIAGFVRTTLGKYSENWELARKIEVQGPILSMNDEIIVPAPADAITYRESNRVHTLALLPVDDLPKEAGTNSIMGMLPLKVPKAVKPEPGLNYWKWPWMSRWLHNESIDVDNLEDLLPAMQERIHIKIDHANRTAEVGALFSTSMVCFEDYQDQNKHRTWSYICRINHSTAWPGKVEVGSLGGERRIGVIEPIEDQWPSCPESLRDKLSNSLKVRMILATPAIFERGWCPKWIDRTTREGTPPGLEGITLKLVSAAVPRRTAVSGWEMEKDRPKPVRWLVPAGSVFFFEVVKGDPKILAERAWLCSVSDLEEQRDGSNKLTKNRADGFGLALWGIWSSKNTIR